MTYDERVFCERNEEMCQSWMFLDKLCFLECLVCPILCDGAEGFCGDGDEDSLSKLRDEDTSLLKVWLTAYFPTRVKLRRTRTVTVASAYL